MEMDIERLLVLEVARVTEHAALAASRLAGMGNCSKFRGKSCGNNRFSHNPGSC